MATAIRAHYQHRGGISSPGTEPKPSTTSPAATVNSKHPEDQPTCQGGCRQRQNSLPEAAASARRSCCKKRERRRSKIHDEDILYHMLPRVRQTFQSIEFHSSEGGDRENTTSADDSYDHEEEDAQSEEASAAAMAKLNLIRQSIATLLQVEQVLLVRRSYDRAFQRIRHNQTDSLDKLAQLSTAPNNNNNNELLHQAPGSADMTLDELYVRAKSAQPEFEAYMSSLRRKITEVIGGHIGRSEVDRLEQDSDTLVCFACSVQVADIKPRVRAAEKADMECDGDVSRLLDILRASVYCKDVTQMVAVLNIIIGLDSGAKIEKIRNGFVRDGSAGGYRDVKVFLRLPKSGFMFELQMHLRTLRNLKNCEDGHSAFCWARKHLVIDEMDGFHLLHPSARDPAILRSIAKVCLLNRPTLDGIAISILTELEDIEQLQMLFPEAISSAGLSAETRLSMRNNWALALDNRGRHEEAEAIHEEVLLARRERYGPLHPDTLMSLNNLALSRSNQGRHQDGATLLYDVLKKNSELLGVDHPHTLIAANNLARTLQLAGMFREASALYGKTLELSKDSLPSGHPIVLNAIIGLVVASSSLSRRGPKHLELLAKEYEQQRKSFGESHPNVIRVLLSIADAISKDCSSSADDKLATQVYRYCWIELSSSLGAKHEDTVNAMVAYTMSTFKNGTRVGGGGSSSGTSTKPVDADSMKLLVDCCTTAKDVLGDLHPKTVECLALLMSIYSHRLGKAASS